MKSGVNVDQMRRQFGTAIRWITIPLLCVAAAFAQKPQPNHITEDIIGESVDDFVDNNPVCAFVSDAETSHIKPRQRERTVLCVPFDDLAALNKKEPDSAYGDTPLKTMDTIFLDEDGLVAQAFEVKRTNYDRLKARLFMEFGLPDQVSQFNGETITWDDGRSRIDLQEGNSSDDVSYLFLSEDEYFWKSVVLGIANGQVGDGQVAFVDGDSLVVQESLNARIKIKIVDR